MEKRVPKSERSNRFILFLVFDFSSNQGHPRKIVGDGERYRSPDFTSL